MIFFIRFSWFCNSISKIRSLSSMDNERNLKLCNYKVVMDKVVKACFRYDFVNNLKC